MAKKQKNADHVDLDNIMQELHVLHEERERAKKAWEESPEGKKALQSDIELAEHIMFASRKSASIEELISLEEIMQHQDLKRHKDEDAQKIISKFMKKYGHFSRMVELMQENPDAYFHATMRYETLSGDMDEIAKNGGLAFLTDNIIVLQDRQFLAPDGARVVLEARIEVARKTAEKFKTLHDKLAAEYKKRQKPAVKSEAKKQQQPN